MNAEGFVFASLLDRPLVPPVVGLLWYFGFLPGKRALLFALVIRSPARSQGRRGGKSGSLDPKLDILKNNGGPTDTLALLADSSAINAGNDATAPGLDQRGLLRLGVSDIGAFEVGGAPLRIPSIIRLANGSIRLQGAGVPNSMHTVHASADLNTFDSAATYPVNADATGAVQHDDADAVGLTKRFYRVSFP